MSRPTPLQVDHHFRDYAEIEGCTLPLAVDRMRMTFAVVRRGLVRQPEAFLGDVLRDAEEDWHDNRQPDRGQLIIDLEPETHARLYARFEPVALEINERYFGLDLDHWHTLRLNRYLAGHPGHHAHSDYGPPEPAKFAFSLMLREPEAGGEIVVHSHDDGRPVALRAGDAVFFPGYELHEVKPVTAGERIALTGWFGGPPLL